MTNNNKNKTAIETITSQLNRLYQIDSDKLSVHDLRAILRNTLEILDARLSALETSACKCTNLSSGYRMSNGCSIHPAVSMHQQGLGNDPFPSSEPKECKCEVKTFETPDYKRLNHEEPVKNYSATQTIRYVCIHEWLPRTGAFYKCSKCHFSITDTEIKILERTLNGDK